MSLSIFIESPGIYLSFFCVFFKIAENRLYYHFNLGDGNKTLTIPHVNVSDGKWHNVTVRRVGNEATLEVTSDGGVLSGRVAGSKGAHRLLDTSGVLYVGANLYGVNGEIRVVDNFEGKWKPTK